MAISKVLVVIVAMIVGARAYVEKLDSVTGGIFDIWNKLSSQNAPPTKLDPSSFSLVYGEDNGSARTLWVISRSSFPKAPANSPIPSLAYSASLGGIVSTYSIDTNGWQHRKFDRLDPTDLNESTFSLRGQLFLLAYSTDEGRAIFKKLLVWDNGTGKWNNVPINIDVLSATVSNGGDPSVRVNAPDPNDNKAYVVSSVTGDASLAQLQITFDGQKAMEGSLISITHFNIVPSFRMVLPAVKDRSIYSFAMVNSQLLNEYFVIDLNTNKMTNSPQGMVDKLEGDDLIFQDKDRAYLIGIRSNVDHHFARNIGAVDLSTGKTYGNVARFPDFWPIRVAVDPNKRLLYIVNIEGGVFVSDLSKWF